MQDVVPTLSGVNATIRKVRVNDREGFFALKGDPEIHEMFAGRCDTYRPMTKEAAEDGKTPFRAPVCLGDRAHL